MTHVLHRPAFKVVVNTVLRAVQLRFTRRPWLVASVFDVEKRDTYTYERFTGRYVFARIEMTK